jgi:hypothetical protein
LISYLESVDSIVRSGIDHSFRVNDRKDMWCDSNGSDDNLFWTMLPLDVCYRAKWTKHLEDWRHICFLQRNSLETGRQSLSSRRNVRI